MKRNKTVFAGYYGFGNAGDELILKALIERSRLSDPASPLVALSRTPSETQAHFGIEAVNRWNVFACLGAMSEAKRFILGGGGLLQESTGSLNHLYYLSLVFFADLLGCRTETSGLGVDPIRQAHNRWLTRWVFNHCFDRIVVRDKASLRVLRSCGVDRSIECQPDLVNEVDVQTGSPRKSNRIALCVAPWHTRLGWDQDLALFCEQVQNKLAVEIDLIPFFPAEDQDLSVSVAKKTPARVKVRTWEKPEDLLSWMSEYGMVVSMRFHALILASKAGVPVVGWGQQAKVRQFCVDQSQPFWDFDRGWNTESILRQITDAWGNRNSPEPAKPLQSNFVYSRKSR